MQQLYNGFSGLYIEVSGRFVRQDNLRRVEHGTRYHDALLLTARKLVWQFIALVLHPDKVEYFGYAFLDFLFILPSGGTKHKLQIIVHRTIGEQLEILKNNAQLAPQLRNVLALDGCHPITEHFGLTGSHIELAIEGFEQAGLAGAHFTHQINELPLVQLQINFAQHTEFLLMYLYIGIVNQCFVHESLCLICNSRARSSIRYPLEVSNTIRW